MSLVRQEIQCHACDQFVQFRIDMELDGNHVILCPNCGHEHCRVVKRGRITDIRWDQRNGPTHVVARATTTTTSTWTSYSNTVAWLQTSGTTTATTGYMAYT